MEEHNCKAPFEIECSACGSHNVYVIGYIDGKFMIKCENCGNAHHDCKYNEMEYKH